MANSPAPSKGNKQAAIGIQHELESKNSFNVTPSVADGIGNGITSEINTSIKLLKDDLSVNQRNL